MAAKKDTSKLIKTNNQKATPKATPIAHYATGVVWLLCTIFILPFLYSSSTYDANVPTRFNFLTVAVLIGMFIFLLQKKMIAPIQLPKLVWLALCMAVLFGVWNIVPLLNAINKQEGYFIIARHFLGIVFLLLTIAVLLKNEHTKETICKALVVMIILQSLVGIAQFYEVGFMEIQGNNSKPIGMMANRNFFGSAQMLLIPFTIYVLCTEKNFWRSMAALGLVLGIFSVIISQTRSAWISSAIIGIVSLVLVVFYIPTLRKRWSVGFLIAAVAAVGLFFLIKVSSNDIDLANATKDRLTFAISAEDVATGSSSANERLVMWDMTQQVIKQKPLVGVGAGNWKFNVMQYVTPISPYAIDKRVPEFAHNEYLQITAEAGYVGLVIYLAFWLTIVFIAFTTLKKTTKVSEKVMIVLLLSGIAGFASDAFFSFPLSRMEHFMYIHIYIAFILAMYCKIGKPHQSLTINKKVMVGVVPLIAVIAAVGFYRSNYQQDFVKARAFYNDKSYDDVATVFNKAKNNWVTVAPNGMPIENYMGLVEKERKNYRQALYYFNEGLKLNPYSMALYINKGTVYTDMKQFDSAIIFYQKALVLAPKSQLATANLAINYFNIQNYTKCLEMIKAANLPNDKNLQQLQQLSEQQLASKQ